MFYFIMPCMYLNVMWPCDSSSLKAPEKLNAMQTPDMYTENDIPKCFLSTQRNISICSLQYVPGESCALRIIPLTNPQIHFQLSGFL
jgi:hypothetical protein